MTFIKKGATWDQTRLNKIRRGDAWRALKKQVTKKTLHTWKTHAPFNHIWIFWDFWGHLGPRWILKWSPNRDSYNKINMNSQKRVSRKVSWKNMVWDWCLMPKWEALNISHNVAKYELRNKKNTWIDNLRPTGQIFEILERLREMWFFYEFRLANNWSPNQKSHKQMSPETSGSKRGKPSRAQGGGMVGEIKLPPGSEG